MFYGRGKNKVRQPYTFPDMYESYIKDKTEDSPYYVTYSEFVNICSDFIKAMMYEVFHKNYKFRLPHRLGYCRVIKKKTSYNPGNNGLKWMSIDWDKTNKSDTTIRHFNEHSNGYKYYFKWYKKSLIFKYNWLYRLVFTRANKRELARLIKYEGLDYYEE